MYQPPPNTYYPPPPQQWQQPPQMPPQRPVRQKYKTAALVCFIVGVTVASTQIPVLTVLAAFLILAGIVLVFLI